MGRQRQDSRPLPMRDRDQADIAERLHGLADRRASDTEALHEFALGRHGVAGFNVRP